MGSRELEKARKRNRQTWEPGKKDDPRAFRQTLLAQGAHALPSDEFAGRKTQTCWQGMFTHREDALPVGLKANPRAGQIRDPHRTGSLQSWFGKIYWPLDDLLTRMDSDLHALESIQTGPHLYPEISFSKGPEMGNLFSRSSEGAQFFNGILIINLQIER